MCSFLISGRPTFTAMVQANTPEKVIELIGKADAMGADAFGVLAEVLPRKMHNIETYKRIIDSAKGKPVYATYYIHLGESKPKEADEHAAKQLINLAKAGAALIDVPGDLFCHEAGELTHSEEAVKKQKELINEIHNLGKEILMSSHVLKFESAERVLEIAKEHKARGADISKIVTGAETIAEEIENLRITTVLKKELGLPFLFLSGGMCHFHRTIGPMLGCDMWLCVPEHNEFSTKSQPQLDKLKIIYENFNCTPTEKENEVY